MIQEPFVIYKSCHDEKLLDLFNIANYIEAIKYVKSKSKKNLEVGLVGKYIIAYNIMYNSQCWVSYTEYPELDSIEEDGCERKDPHLINKDNSYSISTKFDIESKIEEKTIFHNLSKDAKEILLLIIESPSSFTELLLNTEVKSRRGAGKFEPSKRTATLFFKFLKKRFKSEDKARRINRELKKYYKISRG